MAYDQKKNNKRPNGFTELIDFLRDEVKKRNAEKIVMITGAAVAAVILVTAGIFLFGGSKKEDDSISDIVTLTETTKEETSEEVLSNPLVKDAYPEINELVTTYLSAISNADVESYNNIVDAPEPMTKEQLLAKKDADPTESRENIVCYTKNGLLDDTYIVYVYYEVKFYNIDTLVPALDRLYVCRNEDGSVYINRHSQTGEIDAYTQEMSRAEDVVSLSLDVESRMSQAIESDPALADLLKILINMNNEPGDTSGQAQDDTVEESSEDAMIQATEETEGEE